MNVAGDETVLFWEVQHFRQPWLWAVVLGIAALQWWGFVQQILLGIPFGSNPAPDSVMVLLLFCFGIGLPIFFMVLRLEIRVVPGELQFRFYPLHLRVRRVPWKEIAHVEAISYRPFRDYWGWGIRWGRYGQAYTVSGNRALLVTRISGRTFLLGSMRPDELERALHSGGLIAETRRDHV
jgi:hypothetical protein